MGAAERADAFRLAERHSRRVRRLRVLLPAASIVLAVGVIATGIITRLEIGLSIGGVNISAEGLQMDAPRLSGSDGKGRTYQVTAERAVQDLSDPRVIRLYGITADINQADGSSATFKAGVGVYDSGRQTLSLDEDIGIVASDGSAAKLTHAEIDLATGDVTSDAPVDFSSSLGAIRAEGMEVGEKGGSVTFKDGVKMTVNPGAVKNAGETGSPLSATGQRDAAETE